MSIILIGFPIDYEGISYGISKDLLCILIELLQYSDKTFDGLIIGFAMGSDMTAYEFFVF